jgi:hypothetical protein
VVFFRSPCPDSEGYSPASHRGGFISKPGLSVLFLWFNTFPIGQTWLSSLLASSVSITVAFLSNLPIGQTWTDLAVFTPGFLCQYRCSISQ